jgi:hypothetical protein
MERARREPPDDVDPADALGGAAGLPLPEAQPRGAVPPDRDAPRSDDAPESVALDEGPEEG